MKKKILIYVGILCIITFFAWLSIKVLNENNQNNYINYEYHVTLKYNKDWISSSGYSNKFVGKNGFFQISAFDGQNWDIDEVAKHEVSHHLLPYGSNPQISQLTINRHEARIIIPSEDQAKEMNSQAEIIIKYPQVLEVDGDTYYYFILWADKNHIQKIAKSLKFIS